MTISATNYYRTTMALLVVLLFVPVKSFAWVTGYGVTIEEITLWESSESGPIHFRLSNDKWCYIRGNQKNLYSIIVTAHTAKTLVDVHCHDEADQSAGGSVEPAHRLHRIRVK